MQGCRDPSKYGLYIKTSGNEEYQYTAGSVSVTANFTGSTTVEQS